MNLKVKIDIIVDNYYRMVIALKKNNKYLATGILIFFTVLFLLSYPFHTSFIGGLISSACGASMIGGLADWFAVTAIFRKPLGINWPGGIFRTEIIPKNRERIMEELTDLVQNKLLTKEVLKNRLYNLNMYELFIRYIEKDDTKEEIMDFLSKVEFEFLHKIDPHKLGELCDESIKSLGRDLKVSIIISKFIDWMIKEEYDEKVIEILINEGMNITRSVKAHGVIEKFVEDVLEEYERDIPGRKLTNQLLLNLVLKMTPSDIAKLIQDKIVDMLYEAKDSSHPAHRKLKFGINKLSEDLTFDTNLQLLIDTWKNKNIDFIPSIADKVKDNFAEYREAGSTLRAESYLSKYFQYVANGLRLSSEEQKSIDIYIKKAAAKLIDAKHHQIGEIVKDKLNEFSNEELVELIETNAGNDLQMIRINGSVVGGFVGIITYLLTFWIG